MLVSTMIFGLLTGGMGAELPPLSVKGMDLVDPQGNRVMLKGVNLGNWFVIEPWMLGLAEGPGAFHDQYQMEEILSSRFGEAEKDRLMEVYRESWVREEDFAVIRSFGFNVVRLPMNYRQFEDDSRPYELKPDAFVWVDRAIRWAGANGLYVILDMHGVQGGQSPYDHTGRSGQNKLWTEPENEKRLAWLWGELAKRYRNEPAVAAYDVFNEPYGGSHEGQKRVFQTSYEAIRKVDPDTLIFAHGHTDGFAHYGTNEENGWHNVGYQMHYYPGMFGGGDPTPATHARHLQALEFVARQASEFGSPFLIGEMNVVFEAAGGGPLMRRYYDQHAEFGWHTTMWSYKVINVDGGHGTVSWGMVANKEPFERIDIRTAGKEAIEAWMRGLGTMETALNQPLFDAMTAATAPEVDLPEPPPVRMEAPAEDRLPEWSVSEVGGSLQGGLEDLGGGRFVLYGGGNDIWSNQDQFRFLHRSVTGDFDAFVVLEEIEDIESYTKAGLMVREGLGAGDRHFLLSSFPSGELQAAWRGETGGGTEGNPGEAVRGAVKGTELRISRRGDVFTAWYRRDGGEWREYHRTTLAGFGRSAEVGAVALSHDNNRLVRIVYRDLKVEGR